MSKKTTFHRNSSGNSTRVTRETNRDGSGKTTVSTGKEGALGGSHWNIKSETRTDKHGNSYTKRK